MNPAIQSCTERLPFTAANTNWTLAYFPKFVSKLDSFFERYPSCAWVNISILFFDSQEKS